MARPKLSRAGVGRCAAAALVVCLVVVVLGACGGSSKPANSKPSYCSQVSELKKAVEGLANVNIVKGGTDALNAQLQKIQTEAKGAVSALKSDFPSDTTAFKNSLNGLETSAQQLTASPSPAAVADVATKAASTVTAGKDLINATSSKCG